MKYKCTLSSEVRNFVEYQIKCWPMNKKLLTELKSALIPSNVRNFELIGSKQLRRPTEEAAIRIVTDSYILQMELSVNVIGAVYEGLSDEDKELVRLRYWHGNNTPDGIAMKLNMARTTVYTRLNLILVEIARRLGYINLGGC